MAFKKLCGLIIVCLTMSTSQLNAQNDFRYQADWDSIRGRYHEKINRMQTAEAIVIEADGEKPCEAAYAFRIKFKR